VPVNTTDLWEIAAIDYESIFNDFSGATEGEFLFALDFATQSQVYAAAKQVIEERKAA